jgi:hypothetical protein
MVFPVPSMIVYVWKNDQRDFQLVALSENVGENHLAKKHCLLESIYYILWCLSFQLQFCDIIPGCDDIPHGKEIRSFMLGILCNLWSFNIADGKWMIYHDLPHQSDDFPYHIIWDPWSVDWLIGPSCGWRDASDGRHSKYSKACHGPVW